ncbi:MAG: alpha/beta fold hydrolase [Amphiplicatus sp.]
MAEEEGFIDGPNGRLAWRRVGGTAPGVFWLSGFRSTMTGTKASFLADWAAGTGRAYVRFDYSGHGASEGRFEDGSISAWTADALAAFDALTEGPQILVGSSMGGWVAALLALRRAARTAGAVFIAPAPDFTEELVWKELSAAQRQTLMDAGRIEIPSPYFEEPNLFTRTMIEDGRRNLVLGGPVAIAAPVRILQGMADKDVPWSHAARFAALLAADDLTLTLVKKGDHSLSAPADLARLARAIEEVS